MTPVPVPILDLARRILALEAAHADSDGSAPIGAVRVGLKLKAPLSTLMGAAGFTSIMARALVLAKADAPSLATVRVLPDGALSGFDGNGPDQLILVGHLLALLATFIGESLTRRLASEAWPEVAVPKGEGRS